MAEDVSGMVELPPITFRCGSCGVAVGRLNTKHPDGRLYPSPPVTATCPVHGALIAVEMGTLHDVWVQRGRPARLNYKLTPRQ